MKLKRILILMICAITFFTLTSCNKDNSTNLDKFLTKIQSNKSEYILTYNHDYSHQLYVKDTLAYINVHDSEIRGYKDVYFEMIEDEVFRYECQEKIINNNTYYSWSKVNLAETYKYYTLLALDIKNYSSEDFCYYGDQIYVLKEEIEGIPFLPEYLTRENNRWTAKTTYIWIKVFPAFVEIYKEITYLDEFKNIMDVSQEWIDISFVSNSISIELPSI